MLVQVTESGQAGLTLFLGCSVTGDASAGLGASLKFMALATCPTELEYSEAGF